MQRIQRIGWAFVLALALANVAKGQDVAAGPRVQFDLTPVWAARMALADSATLPADVASRTRYVWLRGGTKEELAVLAFVVNSTLSQINTPLEPGSPAIFPLAGGRLVRLDLGLIATDEADLLNLVETWERLDAQNSDFLATVETRRIVKFDKPREIRGKLHTSQWVIDRANGPAAHIASDDPHAAMTREQWNAWTVHLGTTRVPIIDSRDLIRAALDVLEGGLYYEFRGITKFANLKDYLAARGASQEQVTRLESLEKAVIATSAVTDKERMVAVFRGAGVRPSQGTGAVAITFDQFDGDQSDSLSPLENLINFVGRGSEVIIERSNGFHEWTAWDAAGKLVRAVPDEIVVDHRIPEPASNTLRAGISCIRCHGPADGWIPHGNDVPEILAAGTEIFGDLSSPENQRKQAQLIAGLYSGDWFEAGIGPLAIGRITYRRAVFQGTGMAAPEVQALLVQRYDQFRYGKLDVWAVAAELGIVGLPASDGDPETKADAKTAAVALAQFIAASGNSREHGTIATIKAGIPIKRSTWRRGAHIAYERAYQRALP